MGAKYYQVKSPTRIKKCSERISDSCDPLETDGCCAVIPCDYCLEFETYDGIQYGSAPFASSGWAGTIAGAAFFGFWERGYESGEGEFVVTLDGEEVYRKSCYEGQSCRDSSDSAEVTIEYEAGTLRWIKQEYRPLEYRIDEVTGCTVYFCGDCECTVKCLCVTIHTVDLGDGYGSTQYKGEICDSAYPCDGPVWAGIVSDYDISLELMHDSYGNCVIVGTIGDEDVSVAILSGCKDIEFTVTLYDGTEFTFAALTCDRCQEVPSICICNRSLGNSPTLTFSSGHCPSTIFTVDLSYGTINEIGIVCAPVTPCQGYSGRYEGELCLPMGGRRSDGIDFRLVCSIECSGYCLYWRYDGTVALGDPTWCKLDANAIDCECPATLLYGSTPLPGNVCSDTWGYAVIDITVEEDPSNC